MKGASGFGVSDPGKALKSGKRRQVAVLVDYGRGGDGEEASGHGCLTGRCQVEAAGGRLLMTAKFTQNP